LTPSESERLRALEIIKRHGWNATSFQSLEPGLHYWFASEDAACIAYADTGAAWVVAGAPIAPPGQVLELARHFVDLAQAAGRRVCFFATERRLAADSTLASMPIGEQPVWDPVAWPEILRSSRSLREQLRRAKAHGVSVRLAEPSELQPGERVRLAVDELIERWMGRRRMAPLGFLVQVYPFSFAAERHILVAEREGEVIGFLAMVPVYARQGWLLEDLVRDRSSPNGTPELLVDGAMRLAAEEGSRYVTLGLAPLSGRVGRWLRLARAFGSRLYNFEGLRAFKARLRPGRWEPIFLVYPPAQNRLLTLYDTLTAFAPGGLGRFGLETLLRNPEPALKALAVLLVPWTALLAAADTAWWFPAPWVKWGWVAFDLGLLGGLFSLLRRWRTGLAGALATLITADAALTLAQVLVFNLGRARGLLEWVVLVVSLTGPTVTAAFLWAVLSRRPTRSGEAEA
jgi:phosphatidylglycerol lysyltransferase